MTTPEPSWSLTEIAELIEQRLVHGRVVETQHRWDQISADFRDMGFPQHPQVGHGETPALRLTRRSIQQHLKERLLTVVEWLEMTTTDPTVPSCVIQSELDQYGSELRAIYEDLEAVSGE